MEQVPEKNRVLTKAKVQRLGSTLSSMVMPNIGALIAWSVLTAPFIPDGYLPNKALTTVVDPMLTYLTPLLVGYTGGKVIAGDRGAVVGAIVTMGVIMGTDIPMMLGAMIMGPPGGLAIKKFDQYFQHRIKAGFEMLMNNFSAGLIGLALALLGFSAIGPIVNALTAAMARGVEIILNAHLIPLTSTFAEPVEVLFLNNTINHGILTPLGTEQVLSIGKSILFLLETNPGPGLGVLLAFVFFGKGAAKSSAPGAIVIHFLGGIHEIHFPYVMMRPLLFLSVIAGGATGSLAFQTLDASLHAPALPGSIIVILAMTPIGSYLPAILGVLAATAVPFAVSAVVLKADAKEESDEFARKVKETQAAKAASKGLIVANGSASLSGIQQIIFACDIKMGSSAMGASILRRKVQEAGLVQTVTNRAINNLTDEGDILIVTQAELQERAKQKAPNATLVAVENFLNLPRYDEIVAKLLGTKEKNDAQPTTSKATPTFEIEGDLINVNEILLVHDDRVGSATMGMKVLEEILDKEKISVPIRKININESTQQTQALIVTKTELTEQARKRVPKATYLLVESMVSPQEYETVVSLLKEST